MTISFLSVLKWQSPVHIWVRRKSSHESYLSIKFIIIEWKPSLIKISSQKNTVIFFGIKLVYRELHCEVRPEVGQARSLPRNEVHDNLYSSQVHPIHMWKAIFSIPKWFTAVLLCARYISRIFYAQYRIQITIKILWQYISELTLGTYFSISHQFFLLGYVQI